VAAWRETYAGMMPAATLAGLDVAEWTERWRGRLASADAGEATFLALDESGAAGFGHCRPQTSQKLAPLGYSGEIAALYLLRRIQRRGLGTRLLRRMATHLLEHGCDSASVWVFRDAPHAHRFYEAHGAAATGIEGVWEIYGMTLPDLAYGWRDLKELSGQ
jgi:GNAT superfamily N-acetyltransferase